MNLDQYSILLTLGIFALAGVLLISLALYAFVPKARSHLRNHAYFSYLAAIAVIGVGSIIGALIYQLVYLTPVCELCWWQRIFLFPTVVITLVALWYRSRETHVTVAILATFGLFYALYHYYYHFQGLVLGNTLALPCSTVGLLPACTSSPILVFGFVTIPFMGILVFTSMLILAYLASQAHDRSSQ